MGRAVRLDGDNCEEPAGFVKIMIAGEFRGDSTQAREPTASAIVDEFERGSPVFQYGEKQALFAAEEPEHAWLGHGCLFSDLPQ